MNSRPGGSGRVSIVGGGPGDPGLITVRGRELLLAADVVVVDRLAPRELLAELRPEVLVLDATKSPGAASVSQDQINRYLIDHALAGRSVVRLKGGDPYVFGRGIEEVQACQAAGIPVEVVPGVTSATAVPALAGIPLTHIGGAPGFTVVSGHAAPLDPASGLDWRALARSGTTLVLLMAVANLAPISRELRAGGLADDTPVACISEGSTPSQKVVRTTLSQLAHDASAQGVHNPAVIVVGAVAGDLTGDSTARTVRSAKRILVLGGSRSGKSSFAETLLGGEPLVEYVATAVLMPDDTEWQARIAAHKRRRPPTWTTSESQDVARICEAKKAPPALIDSVTAWLTASLDTHLAWDGSSGWRSMVAADVDRFVTSWAGSERHVVAVSDEVGSGVVPESAAGRMFRDELGNLNQRLAAAADEVWQVTAGIPSRLR
ncbi:uroporphyrinogen-III C-methyltransferase [Jatrophihabitans sp. DSM 45814]